MKAFIIALLLFSMPVFAEINCVDQSSKESIEDQLEIKTDVPAFLKGATIIVKLANGKESVVSAEKFKVVPRMQQFIVTKTKQVDTKMCLSKEEVARQDKNRISLLGGAGPSNQLSISRSGNTVSASTDRDAVGGVQYQRLLNDRFSIGGQLQTNDSALLNIGYDF